MASIARLCGSEAAGKANELLEHFDRAFSHVGAVLDLIEQVGRLAGDNTTADRASKGGDLAGTFRGGISCARVLIPIRNVVSGDAFFEENAKGEREVRNFIDILEDISVLGARVLGSINYLGGRGLYHLGNHAKRMSDAAMGLWIAVVSIEAVKDMHFLLTESSAHERFKQKIVDLVCNLIDIAALPFDFGYGMDGSPALAISGIAVRILSSLAYLFNFLFRVWDEAKHG